MIPYGKQEITKQDIQSVIDILNSDFLTQGPAVPEFENKIAKYVGANYATAVNSATSALHLACLALDLKEGDIVWTSPNSFVASSNCALYCRALVDFVDIDINTYNICPQKLEEKLIAAKKINKLPKIVIPVHLCGQSCDMEKIKSLSIEYGFKIIEDASHAIGGKYKDSYIGSCKYSDITVFSFHPVKIITTGEGGMALTNSSEIYSKMNLLRSHGITRDRNLMINSGGAWYYEQQQLGFNYRMTDIQAALGISQLTRLGQYVKKRSKIIDFYNKNLINLPLLTPFQLDGTKSSYHLYVIRLKLDVIKLSHEEVFDYLRSNGIGVNLHYIPIHTHPYYQNLGFKIGDYPNAEQYAREAISLPVFPSLTEKAQRFVINLLQDIL